MPWIALRPGAGAGAGDEPAGPNTPGNPQVIVAARAVQVPVPQAQAERQQGGQTRRAFVIPGGGAAFVQINHLPQGPGGPTQSAGGPGAFPFPFPFPVPQPGAGAGAGRDVEGDPGDLANQLMQMLMQSGVLSQEGAFAFPQCVGGVWGRLGVFGAASRGDGGILGLGGVVRARPRHAGFHAAHAGTRGPQPRRSMDEIATNIMNAHEVPREPTARRARDAFPRLEIRAEAGKPPEDGQATAGPGEACTVCHDMYQPGDCVLELPCDHCFHVDCIMPWLEERSTCPVRRGVAWAEGMGRGKGQPAFQGRPHPSRADAAAGTIRMLVRAWARVVQTPLARAPEPCRCAGCSFQRSQAAARGLGTGPPRTRGARLGAATRPRPLRRGLTSGSGPGIRPGPARPQRRRPLPSCRG